MTTHSETKKQWSPKRPMLRRRRKRDRLSLQMVLVVLSLLVLSLIAVWIGALRDVLLAQKKSANEHIAESAANPRRTDYRLRSSKKISNEYDGDIQGQDFLLRLLRDAEYDVHNRSDRVLREALQDLPRWEDIEARYGSEPRIVGLDTACMAFQKRPSPEEHMISVAGTFNSGTNLLAQLLWENCYMVSRVKKYGATSRGVRWQVPYGKHTPVDETTATFRLNHKAGHEQGIAAENVLPIVAIRDPYFWMSSMCRHPYQMWWPRSNHCPNLVPTPDDPPILQHISSIPVQVRYGEEDGADGSVDLERRHLSMVHHYNEWYGAYLNATFPRVIVRFEDLVFRPRQVIASVCECAGGKLLGNNNLWESGTSDAKEQDDADIPFHYVKDSAKDDSPVHGKHKTGLLEAMLQYADVSHQHFNMTAGDLAFAAGSLDKGILELFRYRILSPT